MAALLLLLRERPAHGYELLEQLPELTGERVDMGNLYRFLRLLESDGIVDSLKRGRGGKVSFTHLIGFAIVRALRAKSWQTVRGGFLPIVLPVIEKLQFGNETGVGLASSWMPVYPSDT